MKKLVLLAGLILASTGIAVAQRTVDFEDSQARVLDVVSDAIVKPLVVDVKVQTWQGDNGRVVWRHEYSDAEINALGGKVENIRANATFIMCNDYKADVIVAATYDIKSKDTHNGYIVTVVGFPANFENWRSVDPVKDAEWIRLKSLTDRDTREKVDVIQKR